jgi:hypothetical protein
MKGISNRKEIINQIPLLAKGEIIPVYSKKAKLGEIFCNRVEYGEFEVSFTQKNIPKENKITIDWNIITNLLDRICYLINKPYYIPFRLESTEVRAFWFSKNRS